MIARIDGTVEEIAESSVTLSAGGLSYEVLLPSAVMKNLEGQIKKNGPLSLITYHYSQVDPSKSIPVLIGFSNRLEKEFFERFITVSGVGPKAAVRALSMPISDIAEAIDAGDLNYLKSLPGIGGQRAKEIIAKLQGKMAKFGLIRKEAGAGGSKPGAETGASTLKEEALEVLLQLQYKKEEAGQMIQKAFARKSDLSSVEEILNEVYRQRKER